MASPGPCPQHPALLPGPAEGQPLSQRLCAFPGHGSCAQHWLRCRRSQPTRRVGGALEKWGRDNSCEAVGMVGCGQNPVEASPGSSCSMRGGAPGACGPLQQWCPATAGNSAAGGIWKHRAQLQGAFPYLHGRESWAGEHCKLGGSPKTWKVEQEIHGVPGGAGCPVSSEEM